MPTPSFAGVDQQVAASAGERKREEKRSTFDLEPPIAGHQSFPKCFGGHGASRLIHLRLLRPLRPNILQRYLHRGDRYLLARSIIPDPSQNE